MKIVIDENIPFLKNVFEPYGRVVYKPGKEINKKELEDTEILVVRTRTRCNGELLQGTGVKMVLTATIGTDHLDIAWLNERGIKWANAPGCNSGSVMQYIASVLSLLVLEGVNPSKTTLGIVGVGMVGTKIWNMARALGFNLLLNDPPRERKEKSGIFTDYESLIKYSDIITYHTPLVPEGPDNTFHHFGNETLPLLKPGVVIINTSRGEVTSTKALLEGIDRGIISRVVLDVWENEPVINRSLHKNTWVGTPHVAGYSIDGKANASRMVVEAISKEFGFPPPGWAPANLPVPGNNIINIPPVDHSPVQAVAKAILATYNPLDDDLRLRENPENFEKLRNSYPPRREFGSWVVSQASLNQHTLEILKKLGFNAG